MDIMPLGGIQVASFLWRTRGGAYAQTIVGKLTYELRPVLSVLAPVQEPVLANDEHWDDNPARSVSAPTDLVPFKARADVVLVGDAFAPRGQPVRSLVARLQVGDLDKSIEVVCDRVWTLDDQLREGKRFTRMPLVYERAGGGPGTSNPVGLRQDGSADNYGNRPIPNLQPPEMTVHTPAEVVPPMGFGPIAPTWPERRGRLGVLADKWPTAGWYEQPMPEAVDARYFNVAPSDQQVEVIRANERIVLENLHREHPRLVTSLPGIFLRARVGRSGKPAEPLDLRADTLWIDTNRGICVVVFRAQVQLASRDEPGMITVELVNATAVSQQDADEDAVKTIVPLIQNQVPTMPFLPGQSPLAHSPAKPKAALPEQPQGEVLATMILPPDAAVELSDTDLEEAGPNQTLPTSFVQRKDADLPFQPVQASPLAPVVTPARPAPVEASRPLPPPVPPPMVRGPIGSDPVGPPSPATPWASAGARAPGRTVGESAVEPAAAPAPVASMKQGSAQEFSDLAAKRDDQIPRRDAVAAKPEHKKEEPKQKPKEVLKLLWFDSKALPEIRKQEQWRVTLAELELRLLEEGREDDDDSEAEQPGAPNPKDRRDVFEILTRGQSVGADGVRAAIEGAIDDEGRFEPPLVLMAGDLELPFDELETLKATVTAATPFAAGDKKLKETLDTVAELLKTPWLHGSGGMAENLTRRVQDAFAQSQRLPQDYLQTYTDRMLLEERRYQKRTVYEQTWIRGLLHLGGQPIPAYLPEALTKGLPMFKRFRVRLLGEVDMREDQYETHPHTVRAVALARVIER